MAQELRGAVYAARMNEDYNTACRHFNSGWISECEWRWYCFFWDWCTPRFASPKQDRAYAKLGMDGLARRRARVEALRQRLRNAA